ncbi:carboxypeptidase-like regulatory domain-containing protein, partial [uncultured Alistipes sp.]
MRHINRRIEIWGLLTVMLALCFQSAAAQPHRPHAGHHGPHASAWLSGKVMEKDNTAVAFATVCLKGTNFGCSTDDRGRFRFKVPAGKHTLAVSLIGYEPVEKDIETGRDMKNLTVVLQPAATEL